MILCVTPNPAIDRTLYLSALRVGEVHRTEKVLTAAGGKGLNVARTIHALGGGVLCMGPIGGYAGKLLAELAKQEGLQAQWTQAQSETRTCTILVQANRDATVINEAGPGISEGESRTLMEAVLKQAVSMNLVCISGSLPKGFSLQRYRSLLFKLVTLGKSVWVDASGNALKTALKVRGVCIKVNAKELGDALGMELSDLKQAETSARELCRSGIRQVAITFGPKGALLVTETEGWQATPPKLEIVSSVGSGDALLGALAFALDQGRPPEIALRYGVAAGAANALHFGGGEFSRAEFDAIKRKVEVIPLRY